MRTISVISLLISLFFTPFFCSADSGHLTNNLQAGDRLKPGEYLLSANGEYRFFLKTGGDMVLKNLNQDKIIWTSKTSNNKNAYLILKSQGNLVLESRSGKKIWESRTKGSHATDLVLHDDGALVLYKNDKVLWAVNDSGAHDDNQKPVVQFIKPSGATVPSDLGVTVEAWDPDGEITRVVLWLDDTVVRADDQAPYAWGTADDDEMDDALFNLAPGTYQLRAVATDDKGAETTVSLLVTVKGGSEDDPEEDDAVEIADIRYSDYDTPVYTINAVELFDADNTGQINAAPAIQKALDRAAANYGGIVYLPRGNYLIKNRLVIPGTVTLRGDWKRPADADKTVKGTVLYIDFGEGTTEGRAISLGRSKLDANACIRDLSIYYPRQLLNGNPKAYPVTIEGIGEFSMVFNITLVNAYKGIRFVPQGSFSVAFPNVRHVYGSPLKLGLYIHNTTATPRTQNLHFAPEYWSESGLDDVSSHRIIDAIRKIGGIGINSGDGDGGGNFAGIHISGYDIGWLISDEQSARVFSFEITGCRIGLDIPYTKEHGWVFTGGRVEAENIALRLRNRFINSQFNNVTFSSNGVLIDHQRGTANFTKCIFKEWGNGYAIKSSGGRLAVAGCDFRQSSKHISLSKSVGRAVIFGNTSGNGHLDVRNGSSASSANIVIDTTTKHNFVDIDTTQYQFSVHKQVPSPPAGSSHIFNVKDFGAEGNGKVDDTQAFKSALSEADNMSTDRQGCIVFVPPGVYRIEGRLTVPRYVELRGVHESPAGLEARSILCSFADKNQPSNPAFITLEADSGISGCYLYRPEQTWNSKTGDTKLHKYPPAIRGTNRNWAYNITLSNMYDGIDFSSGGGHDLDYVIGASLNTVVELSADGAASTLNNFQVKTQFFRQAAKIKFPVWVKSGFGKGAPDDPDKGRGIDRIGTGLVIRGNGTFRFLSHFVNRSADGLYKIIGSPKANFYLCGGEGDGTGFYIRSNDGADMDVEMVSNSYHTSGKAYTVSDTNAGDVIHLINCKNYGRAQRSHILQGSGRIVMQQEYREGDHAITLQLENRAVGIVESGFFDADANYQIRALNNSRAFICGAMTDQANWTFNRNDKKRIIVKRVCPNRIKY